MPAMRFVLVIEDPIDERTTWRILAESRKDGKIELLIFEGFGRVPTTIEFDNIRRRGRFSLDRSIQEILYFQGHQQISVIIPRDHIVMTPRNLHWTRSRRSTGKKGEILPNNVPSIIMYSREYFLASWSNRFDNCIINRRSYWLTARGITGANSCTCRMRCCRTDWCWTQENARPNGWVLALFLCPLYMKIATTAESKYIGRAIRLYKCTITTHPDISFSIQ